MFSIIRQFIKKQKSDFPGSASYWEQRYAGGGNSGCGSYGRYADFKAEFLNRFVVEHGIRSVIEFGCGDGNQLSLGRYPEYIGVDISPTAIRICSERFQNDPSKSFFLAGEKPELTADLAMSLDVTFHLVEEDIFVRYMTDLFAAAARYVIIYSSDQKRNNHSDLHVWHRPVSKYVAQQFHDWKLESRARNPFPRHPTLNFAEFMVFARRDPLHK